MKYKTFKEKINKIFIDQPKAQIIFEAIFVSLMMLSFFIKAFYLQYTIKLSLPPFNSNTRMHVFLLLTSMMIVIFISVFFPKKYRGALLSLDIFLSFVLFVDALYGRYYSVPVTVPIIYQIGFVNDVSGSAKSLLKIKDIIFLLDLPVLFLLVFSMKKLKSAYTKRLILIRSGIYIVAFVCVFSAFKFIDRTIDHSSYAYERKYIARDFGTYFFHGYDIADTIAGTIRKNTGVSEEQKESIAAFYNIKPNNGEKTAYSGVGEGLNLLVIQVEAFQQFPVGMTIEGQEVTPFINKLMKESLYFNNIYHQVAGGNTADAEFMLNNSLYPAKSGAANYINALNHFQPISMLLKEKNYTAKVFHGYQASFWNREAMYKKYGYDEFVSLEDFDVTEKIGWAISDAAFFKQSLDVSVQNKPFYSFLITLSSHHPYDAFRTDDFNVGQFTDTQVGDYLKGIHYVDQALEDLVDDMDQKGILDNTVLVIYGDHSGLFRDQQADLSKLLEKDLSSNLQWEEIQKVPLLISIPGQKEGKVIDKVGGQVDILPTLADIMGLQSGYFMGNNLLINGPGYVVKRDGTVVTDDYLYLASESNLYDIQTNALVADQSIMEQVKSHQKDLVISDIILEKDLLYSDRLDEVTDKK